MEDPVIASDGYTYDRKSIEERLQNSQQSPMTLLSLGHKNFNAQKNEVKCIMLTVESK